MINRTRDSVKDILRASLIKADTTLSDTDISFRVDTCMCDIPIERIRMRIIGEGEEEPIAAVHDESFDGEPGALSERPKTGTVPP